MSDIVFIGIKLSNTEHTSTRIDTHPRWRIYELNPNHNYDNLIWIPSPSHKDQALLLLSLGLGKQEIEEYFNIGK